MPSTRRWMRCPASPRSPASARSSRRCADTDARHRASTPRRSARSRFYWEAVRTQYAAFESDLKVRRLGSLSARDAGRAVHQPQGAGALARAWRRAGTRWRKAYRDVNDLFGDIVKVTPSSKVVGDMALMMVAQDLTRADVARSRAATSPSRTRWCEMLRGDLGQPPGGWPEALQKKVLKGAKPITARPGSLLPPADLEAERRRRPRQDRPPARRATSSPPT